jgi:hypothetical protein
VTPATVDGPDEEMTIRKVLYFIFETASNVTMVFDAIEVQYVNGLFLVSNKFQVVPSLEPRIYQLTPR